MPLDLASKPKIGVIAGWGDFPLAVARRLVLDGYRVFGAGIRDHTHSQFRDHCEQYSEFGLGQMGRFIRFMNKYNVQQLTMAGKVHKKKILERGAIFKHLPDWTFWKYFHRHFWSGTANRNDDTLLTTVTKMFEDHGIRVASATEFAPELLVNSGCLTQRQPKESQWRDIAYGWRLAKEMGRLDIGQSVVVKGQAILAVEAIEGTDECIRRAGQLCPAGGFTVVKVAKPNQDMRFDVPTVGVGTIHTMREAGAKVLAIESHQTIILNERETIQLAQQHGIVIVATDGTEFNQRIAAA